MIINFDNAVHRKV